VGWGRGSSQADAVPSGAGVVRAIGTGVGSGPAGEKERLMSAREQTFVVVGASLAGAKAAETLREEGFDGRVVLIGDDPERPYERPPLTKDYLRDESPREKAFVHSEAFYPEHDIELLTGVEVTELDPARKRLTLEDGRELGYDRLLLSTGAEPRPISIPGAELDGVYYLRTLADCDALRARLETAGAVVVIGAGWIGSEFAASARVRGAEVTIVEPASVPLERVLGLEVGGVYRDLHREHGVQLLCGTGVAAFEGDEAVRRVRTSDDRLLDCDYVVVGIGAAPRTQLAERAGLDSDNGIVVDERLCTSAPDVYAAGDVASAWHPFYEQHVRVEHWSNALNQGPAAAKSMLGQAVSYDRIPYFYSDQYDVGMEYSGYATEWDEVVFRGDPASREFVAFWLHEQRVVAGMNVNVWDVNEHVQALIRSRRVVETAELTDPDTTLESLVDGGEARAQG
jgi:3-phenylpropionate/trans-cinnamate dioxygenase ferredoxin reductase component